MRQATINRQDSGQAAEQKALQHLLEQGLRLICQNWRGRRGELDLVMLEGDTVVFVEVRYRRHNTWGGALESIDNGKRQRLILTAQQFLQQHPRWQSHPCRFDVVALGGDPPLQWLAHAFEC